MKPTIKYQTEKVRVAVWPEGEPGDMLIKLSINPGGTALPYQHLSKQEARDLGDALIAVSRE